MTLAEFLQNSNTAFVKPTARQNGLNFRTEDGRITATVLVEDCPEESEILAWVKARLNHTVRTSPGSNIISINAPVEKGVSLAGLFDEPKAASKKKVKA